MLESSDSILKFFGVFGVLVLSLKGLNGSLKSGHSGVIGGALLDKVTNIFLQFSDLASIAEWAASITVPRAMTLLGPWVVVITTIPLGRGISFGS